MMFYPRHSASFLLIVGAVVLWLADLTLATKIRGGSDPTAIKVGGSYYSAESAGGGIYVLSVPLMFEGSESGPMITAKERSRLQRWSQILGEPSCTFQLVKTRTIECMSSAPTHL